MLLTSKILYNKVVIIMRKNLYLIGWSTRITSNRFRFDFSWERFKNESRFKNLYKQIGWRLPYWLRLKNSIIITVLHPGGNVNITFRIFLFVLKVHSNTVGRVAFLSKRNGWTPCRCVCMHWAGPGLSRATGSSSIDPQPLNKVCNVSVWRNPLKCSFRKKKK